MDRDSDSFAATAPLILPIGVYASRACLFLTIVVALYPLTPCVSTTRGSSKTLGLWNC